MNRFQKVIINMIEENISQEFTLKNIELTKMN